MTSKELKAQYQNLDYVEVEITTFAFRLVVEDPNGERIANLNDVPCIIGPEWAFAGFVFASTRSGTSWHDYYDIDSNTGECDYATHVKFRRIGGAK